VDPNILVEEQSGTALVTVLNENQPAIRLTPFPGFSGPLSIAIGDVNGDGRRDVVIGAGPGGGPHVKAFNARTGELISSFFAYDPSFRGGVYLDAADINGNGRDEIVTGAGFGGGPHVRAFQADGTEVLSFFTFEPSFRGGVRVSAFDTNGNGRAEIITAAGPGGGPRVSIFDSQTRTEIASFFAFAPSYTGGINLRSIGQRDGTILLEVSPATTRGIDPFTLPFSRLMDLSTMVPPSSAGSMETASLPSNDTGWDDTSDPIIV
jgi:hypothetical protein